MILLRQFGCCSCGLHELQRQLTSCLRVVGLGGDAADEVLQRCLAQATALRMPSIDAALERRGGCTVLRLLMSTMMMSISCAAAARAHYSLELRGISDVPMLYAAC